MKKLSVVVLCVLSSLNLFAGDRVGNGGDVIVCDNSNQEKSYEVLDLFEMKNSTYLVSNLGLIQKDYLGKVEDVISNLTNYDPFLAKHFRNNFELLKKSKVFTDTAAVGEINDSNISYIDLPEHCQLEQAAVQLKNPGEFEPKFIFDRAIWEELDEENKAGLVLHELAYLVFLDDLNRTLSSYHADDLLKIILSKKKLNAEIIIENTIKMKKGEINSDTVRRFVQLISSQRFFKGIEQTSYLKARREFIPFNIANTTFKSVDAFSIDDNYDYDHYLSRSLDKVGLTLEELDLKNAKYKKMYTSTIRIIKTNDEKEIINSTYPGEVKSILINEKNGNVVKYQPNSNTGYFTKLGTFNCNEDGYQIINDKEEKFAACISYFSPKPKNWYPVNLLEDKWYSLRVGNFSKKVVEVTIGYKEVKLKELKKLKLINGDSLKINKRKFRKKGHLFLKLDQRTKKVISYKYY